MVVLYRFEAVKEQKKQEMRSSLQSDKITQGEAITPECWSCWSLLFLQGINLSLQGSRTGSNFHFAQKLNYGLSWNKLHPFMDSNYARSLFLK